MAVEMSGPWTEHRGYMPGSDQQTGSLFQVALVRDCLKHLEGRALLGCSSLTALGNICSQCNGVLFCSKVNYGHCCQIGIWHGSEYEMV